MPRLDPGQPPKQSLTAGDRDAALARVSRTRRWLLGGAAALTAGLAALASALVPGRSLASKHPATSSAPSPVKTPTRKTEPPLPAPASSAQLGLRAPDQAPQPDPSQQSAPAQPDPSQQSAPAQPAAPAPQPSQPSDPSQSSGSSSGSGAATSGGS